MAEVLQDILPYIRFPTMTMEELASVVTPAGVLRKDQLLNVFIYLGTDEAEDKKPEVAFPIALRKRHRDEWRLNREDKCETISLSPDDMRATLITRGGHAWVCGTKVFYRGKYAWRTQIESLVGNQWIFIGIIAVGHPHSGELFSKSNLSFADSTAWGFSSANQRYAGGVKRRTKIRRAATDNIDWKAGHRIDCLLDLEKNQLRFTNVSTHREWTLDNLPAGKRWVPHYNVHQIGNKFKVETIQIQDYGH